MIDPAHSNLSYNTTSSMAMVIMLQKMMMMEKVATGGFKSKQL